MIYKAAQYFTFLGIILAITGCASQQQPAKYATNWDKLKIGMNKDEVVELLGEPPSKSLPRFDENKSWLWLDNVLGVILLDILFDIEIGIERWEYGKFELLENLLKPSDKAFVVYFDFVGTVIHFRRPLTGSYATDKEEMANELEYYKK